MTLNQRALEIRRLVLEEKKSLAAIAREMGISRQRVSIILKEAGIDLSLKGGNPKPEAGFKEGWKRADGSTYSLSKVNYRVRIPREVEEKFTQLEMTSEEITAWLRAAVEDKAFKDFKIDP